MAEPLRVTIELAAQDNGSRVLNIAFDRIANRAASTASKISKAAFDVSKKAALVGGLIAAPLSYATKQAVDFEDAMAGVAKVTNTTVGSAKFVELGRNAKGAAVEIGIGADNAAELMASLASGGVAEKDLAEMTVTAGKVGVAFDLAAKDAGDSFVKMRNALGITNKEARLAADSFNFISDNDASTAAQILTYMANGGASMARTLKIAAPQAATFGSALISMGKSGEEAATIMLRFQKAIYLKGNEDMLAKYKAAGRGAAGLMAVLKAGGDIKDQDKQFAYFQRMGEYGTSISQLSKSYGVLQKNMALVAKESNYNGSVNKEFANRNSTVKGQISKLKAEAGVLAVEMGEVLLPVLRDFVKDVAPLLRQLGQWIKDNPTLTAQIVKGAAAMSALSFAVSGVSSVVGGAAKAIDVFGPSLTRAGRLATSFGAGLRNRAFEGTFKLYERFPKIGEAVYKFGGRLSGIGTTAGRVFPMIANAARGAVMAIAGFGWPVALAAVAIAALGYVIYKNWDKLRPAFVNTWRVIRNVTLGTWDTVANFAGRLWDGLTSKFTWLKTAVNWVSNAVSRLKAPDWLKSIGNGIANMANNSASWANAAAAKRGIDRNLTGAVAGTGSPVVSAAGRTVASPMLRVNSAVRAPGAAPVALPAPVGRGGGNVQVHAPLNVTLQGGTSASQKEDVKKMLTAHGKHIQNIVAEGQRRKSNASFE